MHAAHLTTIPAVTVISRRGEHPFRAWAGRAAPAAKRKVIS